MNSIIIIQQFDCNYMDTSGVQWWEVSATPNSLNYTQVRMLYWTGIFSKYDKVLFSGFGTNGQYVLQEKTDY